MTPDLTDEETTALTQELHNIVENDRYPFSPRIRTLRGILAKLRPEPVREPLPPLKRYGAAESYRGQKAALIEIRAGSARYARKLGCGRCPPNGMVQGMQASG